MSDSHLGDAERDELRRGMHEELERLAGEIRTLVEITAPVAPDRAIGRLSRLEAINEKSVNEAALRSARVREAGIRRALTQLDDEDFGYCEACGEPIPLARLRSMPGTRSCVPCAEKAEG